MNFEQTNHYHKGPYKFDLLHIQMYQQELVLDTHQHRSVFGYLRNNLLGNKLHNHLLYFQNNSKEISYKEVNKLLSSYQSMFWVQ